MSNTSLLGSFGGLGESSLMFRNRIINGDMKVWQRATSGAHTGNQVGSYVSADRWKIVGHQSGVSYLGATLERSIDVPSGRLYSAKAISTAAGIDDFVVGQIIESANTFDLVGQSVTFSVQMKKLATLTGAIVRMEVCYLNTIDTSPTDWLNNGGATVISSRIINAADFATSWAQYTLTTGVLPAQAANGLVVRLRLEGSNLGSGDLFAFTDAQLEAGSVATPFERRPIGVELGMCQRYYEKSYNIDVAPGTNSQSGVLYHIAASDSSNNSGPYIQFRVPKRATPITFTAYRQAGSLGWEYERSGVYSSTTTIQTLFLGVSGGLVFINVGAGFVPCSIWGHWTASAEL
jgi:hypothetical protein